MQIIDLSVPIASNMQVFPHDPEVSVSVVRTHAADSYEVRRLVLGSHTGTHVDAFSHMHPELFAIDEIPLTRFFGRAVVVEIKDKWPPHVGLFFREQTGLEKLEKILDSSPPFVGGLISEPLQRALLKNDIVTYTDLVNLECIPLNQTFTFYGFPLRIKGADGSPVRAVAVLDEKETRKKKSWEQKKEEADVDQCKRT